MWTEDVAEMMMIYICANAALTPPQTGVNGANITARISVKSLLWDVVKVENLNVLQAGKHLEETVLWIVMNLK